MLGSLEITNFRVFSHLVIERLGRVNLVVGKNNVGKTCLLEALRLYDSQGALQTIEAILASRNEVRMDPVHQRALPMLEMLFHKKTEYGSRTVLSIGPRDDSDEANDRLLISGNEVALATVEHPPYSSREIVSVGGLSIHVGGRSEGIACEALFSSQRGIRRPVEELPYLTSTPVPEDILGRWWDQIVLTELKDDVVKTVGALDPAVQDISFVAHPLDPYRRMAMVRTSSIAGAVPLRSLGDGAVRIFALAAALQYRSLWAEPGKNARVLLIDEIENGIHHSHHADLWRAVFRLARLNDVQVFATTHSSDCLRGFAEAMQHDDTSDGLVIRLEKVEGHDETGAVVFDRNELPIVVRDSIEVR